MSDWTQHYHYEEINTLTTLQMDGFIAKEKMEEVNAKIDKMFDQMYFEGVNCEGYEPKWEVAKKAMLEGKCDEKVYHDYQLQLINGKLYHSFESDGFGTCEMTDCNSSEQGVNLYNGLCKNCAAIEEGPIDD